MTATTRWVLAHKRIVVAFWLVLTLVGIASAGTATKALKQKFTVPGREGFVANQQIARDFHGTGGNGAPLLAVVTLPARTSVNSPAVERELRAVEARLERTLPGTRLAGYASTHSSAFLSGDGRTTFVIAYPPPDRTQAFEDNPKAAEKAGAAFRGVKIAGAPVYLTGFDALSVQSGGGNGPGVLVEALFGGLGALLVLAFVFGSFLALVPMMMAIASIMTTFLVVWGLTAITEVSPIVQFLIALIGLGVSIDYSLLVVVRWREERAHGLADEAAIERAMQTAGRAVVFSGTTVAIGLLALVALPLPFLRSVGYGGMLIPLISVLVAMTLLPVVLAKLGPRLDWPHIRDDDKASSTWTRWASLVVRRRWIAALGAALVLAALVLAATNLQLGISDVNTIAKQGNAKQGLLTLERSGIGAGVLLPNEVLVGGATSASRSTSPEAVARALAAVPGVHGAVAPDSPQWRRPGAAVVDAFTSADASTQSARDTLDRARTAAHAAGANVKVGGLPAQNADFIKAVYGNFPLMIALIALITFVLLARAFRSLLLPLKAVILNVISVGAAWGVLELVWQNGHGSSLIWGIAATGSITSWIPLMVFAFLFGLSMDYEVFILARMREEYDATGSTDTAVVRGIGRTGRLVTSAALILFLAFVSLASGPETEIKVLATGLAAGILLDATVIRALLVPAVVSLFGSWNWWLPKMPARLLRVEPSPRHARPRVSPRPRAHCELPDGRRKLALIAQLLRELVCARRAEEDPVQRGAVFDGERQAGDAAAHDEDFVEADAARDIEQPRQAQADFDARAHGLADGVSDNVHVADVGARDANVAHQPEHLLPQGEPQFDVVVADVDAHGRTAYSANHGVLEGLREGAGGGAQDGGDAAVARCGARAHTARAEHVHAARAELGARPAQVGGCGGPGRGRCAGRTGCGAAQAE
jgi:RND superfamily putative drug exporter